MATFTGLTIEDFEKLPDELALNHELVDGELVDVSGNVPVHNILRDFMVELLSPFVRQQKLGLIISEQEYAFAGNAHGPDVSLIGPEKVLLLQRHRRVQLFVPDLAIEVVSENDKVSELLRKVLRYRKCGTKEVWVFSIETRLALHFAGSGDRILREGDDFQTELIPGFSIRLGELFDRCER